MLKNTDKSYFTYNYVLEFKYNFGQFLCKNSHEIFSAIFTHFVSIFDAFLTASVFTTKEKVIKSKKLTNASCSLRSLKLEK